MKFLRNSKVAAAVALSLQAFIAQHVCAAGWMLRDAHAEDANKMYSVGEPVRLTVTAQQVSSGDCMLEVLASYDDGKSEVIEKSGQWVRHVTSLHSFVLSRPGKVVKVSVRGDSKANPSCSTQALPSFTVKMVEPVALNIQTAPQIAMPSQRGGSNLPPDSKLGTASMSPSCQKNAREGCLADLALVSSISADARKSVWTFKVQNAGTADASSITSLEVFATVQLKDKSYKNLVREVPVPALKIGEQLDLRIDLSGEFPETARLIKLDIRLDNKGLVKDVDRLNNGRILNF